MKIAIVNHYFLNNNLKPKERRDYILPNGKLLQLIQRNLTVHLRIEKIL